MSVIGRVLGAVSFLFFLLLMPAFSIHAADPPLEPFQAAVELFDQGKYPEARDAFTAIISSWDTPENRRNIEFDSILGGSHYYIAETYFQEDNHTEAAPHYQEVIGSFHSFKAESIYHLGLGKYYQQDYAGAIATLGELVAQFPSSILAPQGKYYQGICLQLIGDKAGAAATFTEMAEKYPDHPWSKKALEKASE